MQRLTTTPLSSQKTSPIRRYTVQHCRQATTPQARKALPTATSADELANQFADFFHNKIAAIRNDLSVGCPTKNPYPTETSAYNVELTEFRATTERTVNTLINNLSLKSCDLDPFPASVLRGCLDILLPVLTRIINLSIENATMPTQLKEAMVKPKLKKDPLDFEILSNFRPNLKPEICLKDNRESCCLSTNLVSKRKWPGGALPISIQKSP